MKRIVGIILPLLLVAACSDTEEPAGSGRTRGFTAAYDMGTQVVLLGKTTTASARYVQLDGKVTQVDDLDTSTIVPNTSAACQTDLTKTKTEMATEVSSVSKTRISGYQKAWILPSNYGTAPGEPGANVWGDPSSGWLFVTEPDINILLATQSAGAGDNRHLTQYLRTTPINLFIFEADTDSDSKTMTTVSTVATNSLVVNIDETFTAGNRRGLTTYGRFDIDNFVWQTGNLNALYTGAPVNYGATMVVPESVKVGDTWLSNGGALMSAVGVDAIDVGGGKKVAALHVIQRGSTDVDMTANGVVGWCVNYYTGTKTTTTESRDTAVTDLCDSTAAYAAGGPGVNGVGTGWINLRHTWYYKGLPVKIEQDTVDVSVSEFGYSVPNPAGIFNGGLNMMPVPSNLNNAGTCARYEQSFATSAVTYATSVKPYALFSVSKTHEVWTATEVKNGYTIAKEYAENK